MNPQEHELTYPLGDTLPAAGQAVDVAPGVRWLRMGLPFALNHVNLWLLEDGDGWTVVDCGIATDATREAWEQVFAQELGGRPVTRVIATHCHPDHVGLAGWLCERWNASLWMTVGEYAFARMMSAALPGADGPSMVPHFRRHGLTDPEKLAQLEGRKAYYPTLVPTVPEHFIRLDERYPVKIGAHDWRVITGTGHSPEHAALYCEALGVLVSGDMVLPSHGKPFRGLQRRIAQLGAHHAERLAEVREACVTPQSAADIVPLMFRRELDTHQLTFAMGEALAHLHRLWQAGELARQEGSDGVLRFVRKGTSDTMST